MTTIPPALPTTTMPCPAWCTMRPGHGWESGDVDEECRGHERKIATVVGCVPGVYGFATVYVSLDAEETLTVDEHGATSTLSQVDISLDTNGNGMTGPQAREVAAALVEAADLWDQVSG